MKTKLLTIAFVLFVTLAFTANANAANCGATMMWDAPVYKTIRGTCEEDTTKPLNATELADIEYEVRIKAAGATGWGTTDITKDLAYPVVGECGTSIDVQGCSKFPETPPEDMCCTEILTHSLSRPTPGCMKNFTIRDK